MTPELQAAINTLLAVAETAAYHWQTASAVALPLRAAIAAVREAMNDMPPIRSDDEISDMADRLAESEYAHSDEAHQ